MKYEAKKKKVPYRQLLLFSSEREGGRKGRE